MYSARFALTLPITPKILIRKNKLPMKPKDKNKEIDVKEVAITFQVDSDLISKVRKGEITHLSLDITEKNQNNYLKNFNGHLLLAIDELPATYHGCYLYNDGVFPYILKDTLEFLLLVDGDDKCLVHIISKEVVPGIRFRFQGPNELSVEDPNGDSCIWELRFEILTMPEKLSKYLMRWNPSISSFKEEDYKECVENMKDGKFYMNWSIYEWEEARRGDMFYMLRTGDDKAGIAFNGYFLSDPYTGDDWAGTTKRRCYVDMICQNAVEPGEIPFIPMRKLKEAIPDYNWDKGHSGELLSEDVCEKLDELWANG